MTITLDPPGTTSGAPRPLGLQRHFTTPGVDPYSLIAWEMRTATITDESGKAFFTQGDVEMPGFWSQTATQVVASKYFRGRVGTPERESSARQLVDRIVNVMTGWGRLAAAPDSHTPYFASEDEAATFANEL